MDSEVAYADSPVICSVFNRDSRSKYWIETLLRLNASLSKRHRLVYGFQCRFQFSSSEFLQPTLSIGPELSNVKFDSMS